MRTKQPPRFPRTYSDPVDAVEALIRLQSFEGAFGLDVLSFVKLAVPVDEARAAMYPGISDAVAATVIAAAYLNDKIGPEVDRDVWDAVFDKARAFVEKSLKEVGVSVDNLLATAVLA